ncbi:MAG: hypothetical protein ABIA11_01820 [Patescibacteria group bacterium]
MSFWELLALVGVMATILGVFLTIYAVINNKTLKEESRGIREILSRIEQGQTEARKEMAEAIKFIAQLIKTEGEKTREAIKA